MDDWKMIGKRLRELRKKFGLTQAEVGAAAEVGRSHITNVEKGKDRLSLDALNLLAAEFHTSVSYLIGEAEPPPQEPDPDRSKWNQAFDELEEEVRKAILLLIPIGEPPLRPPPRPAQTRQRKKKASRPTMGGNVTNQTDEDCSRVIPLRRERQK